MKTLWIIDHYASEPKHGGISRQFDFANELANRGYKVIVISSSFSHYKRNYLFEDNYNIVETSKNVYFVYLRTLAYKSNGVDRLKNMLSYVKRTIDRKIVV